MRTIRGDDATAAIEQRLGSMLEALMEAQLRGRLLPAMPILIGGTALRRADGLTRPSTDLDFGVPNPETLGTIVRASRTIAQAIWGSGRIEERSDGEAGYAVVDTQGQALVKIGGLQVSEATLALGEMRRGTWTLAVSGLAAMKVDVATRRRTEPRDLYDLGHIAEHFPGALTGKQLGNVAATVEEAGAHGSGWREAHRRDPLMRQIALETLCREVRQALAGAMVHLEGAAQGRWRNEREAETEARKAYRTTRGAQVTTQRAGSSWIAKVVDYRGESVWEGRMENGTRGWRLRNRVLEAEGRRGWEDDEHESERDSERQTPEGRK